MLEDDAFSGETIKIRRKRTLGAEEAHTVGASGAERDQHQVGLGCSCGARETNKDQTHAGDDFSDHDSKCRVCAGIDQNLKTPSLDVHRSPRTILCTCSSDFQSHPDVVITTHRYPGRQPGSQSGSRTIFCSDCALQKTSSCGMPAGSVRRGVEPPSLLPSCSGRSGWVQEADHPWY